MLNWEQVAENTFRLKVYNGWLVRHVEILREHRSSGYSSWSEARGITESMTFVVDQTHAWELKPNAGGQHER